MYVLSGVHIVQCPHCLMPALEVSTIFGVHITCGRIILCPHCNTEIDTINQHMAVNRDLFRRKQWHCGCDSACYLSAITMNMYHTCKCTCTCDAEDTRIKDV